MAGKSKAKTKVRKHDPAKPPAEKPTPPGVAPTRPVPSGVELKAQRLIRDAGSADDAKGVIERTVERESANDFLEDNFAVRWGFSSRQELLAASKPLFEDDGSSWWATQLPTGRWIVWSREDFSAKQTFDSLEAVRQAVGEADDSPSVPAAD